MRSGLLGQMLNEMPMSSALLQQQPPSGSYGTQGTQVQSELPRPSSTASTSSGSGFPWQQDIKPNLAGLNALQAPAALDVRGSNKENVEDVEVMSTDSSSSSSSDSQ